MGRRPPARAYPGPEARTGRQGRYACVTPARPVLPAPWGSFPEPSPSMGLCSPVGGLSSGPLGARECGGGKARDKGPIRQACCTSPEYVRRRGVAIGRLWRPIVHRPAR
jgi:hypothetical protein